jgi:hypothetical protein
MTYKKPWEERHNAPATRHTLVAFLLYFFIVVGVAHGLACKTII